MKKTYFLTEMGRQPIEYGTIAEARSAMASASSYALKSAKQKHPTAARHRFGDHVRITLDSSCHSAVWTAFGITAV